MVGYNSIREQTEICTKLAVNGVFVEGSAYQNDDWKGSNKRNQSRLHKYSFMSVRACVCVH